MRLYLSGDQRLVVKDGAGAIVYEELPAVAFADAGVAIAMPEGMVRLSYDQAAGQVCHYDRLGNAEPAPGVCAHPAADAILAQLAALQAAKTARLTPPPPTAEEQQLAARLEADRAEMLQAKGAAALLQLVNATPAQLVTWCRGNFPSMTQAEQDRMATVLFGLAVAIRPHIR